MSIYSIYKVQNNINDKIYIGFTSKLPDDRWNRHLKTARNEVGYH